MQRVEIATSAHTGGVTLLRPIAPSRTDDPVVVYDVMWEAANRLTAEFAAQVTEGGVNDPAIQQIWAVRDQAEAVPTGDIDAQRSLTEEFVKRRESLLRAS